MKNNINSSLSLYLFIILFFSIFFLFYKSQTGNDSTIAEWLINYEGGFTKRGIVGQISITISRIFDLDLRFTILIFQILSCSVFYYCIFKFFKSHQYDRFSLLALFSPIFILYPVAEIEVLARKEMLVFILYFLYLFLPKYSSFKNLSLCIYFILAILIWEPIIFYTPVFIAIEIIDRKIEKINFDLLKIFSFFVPGIILGFFMAINPMSDESYNIMKNVLQNDFGENCYGACSLLNSKSTILQQFEDNIPYYSLEILLRYFLIIIIGFGPLFILLKNSKFKNTKLIFFNLFDNLLLPILICLIPVIVLFAMGYDWGRWVNITYFFTLVFYFYFEKQNHLIKKKDIKKNIIFKLTKKTFIFIFIMFCFSWNPKTVMTGDVGSFPIYRVPYKAVKIFNNNF